MKMSNWITSLAGTGALALVFAGASGCSPNQGGGSSSVDTGNLVNLAVCQDTKEVCELKLEFDALEGMIVKMKVPADSTEKYLVDFCDQADPNTCFALDPFMVDCSSGAGCEEIYDTLAEVEVNNESGSEMKDITLFTFYDEFTPGFSVRSAKTNATEDPIGNWAWASYTPGE